MEGAPRVTVRGAAPERDEAFPPPPAPDLEEQTIALAELRDSAAALPLCLC
ncbi:MAG: hypothetical protein QM820_22425 [Minicystis sp.]